MGKKVAFTSFFIIKLSIKLEGRLSISSITIRDLFLVVLLEIFHLHQARAIGRKDILSCTLSTEHLFLLCREARLSWNPSPNSSEVSPLCIMATEQRNTQNPGRGNWLIRPLRSGDGSHRMTGRQCSPFSQTPAI